MENVYLRLTRQQTCIIIELILILAKFQQVCQLKYSYTIVLFLSEFHIVLLALKKVIEEVNRITGPEEEDCVGFSLTESFPLPTSLRIVTPASENTPSNEKIKRLNIGYGQNLRVLTMLLCSSKIKGYKGVITYVQK